MPTMIRHTLNSNQTHNNQILLYTPQDKWNHSLNCFWQRHLQTCLKWGLRMTVQRLKYLNRTNILGVTLKAQLISRLCRRNWLKSLAPNLFSIYNRLEGCNFSLLSSRLSYPDHTLRKPVILPFHLPGPWLGP